MHHFAPLLIFPPFSTSFLSVPDSLMWEESVIGSEPGSWPGGGPGCSNSMGRTNIFRPGDWYWNSWISRPGPQFESLAYLGGFGELVNGIGLGVRGFQGLHPNSKYWHTWRLRRYWAGHHVSWSQWSSKNHVTWSQWSSKNLVVDRDFWVCVLISCVSPTQLVSSRNPWSQYESHADWSWVSLISGIVEPRHHSTWSTLLLRNFQNSVRAHNLGVRRLESGRQIGRHVAVGWIVRGASGSPHLVFVFFHQGSFLASSAGGSEASKNEGQHQRAGCLDWGVQPPPPPRDPRSWHQGSIECVFDQLSKQE